MISSILNLKKNECAEIFVIKMNENKPKLISVNTEERVT